MTLMSSSGGDNGPPPAVVSKPTWLGELLGDVVLCALQFMEMGPSDDEVGSANAKAVWYIDIVFGYFGRWCYRWLFLGRCSEGAPARRTCAGGSGSGGAA